MTEQAVPLGGSVFTKGVRILAAFVAVALLLILWRLVFGLGSVTALNDGYPWGLWIAFDVVTGTAFACGGYALAILVYVFNKGQYHPLVRPALLTSALGYTVAGFSVFLDVGRWWSIWHVPLYVTHWNLDSALLEVALCIMSYVTIVWIELSPAFFEKWQSSGNERLRRFSMKVLPVLKRSMIWVIAFGLLFPTLHQASLGTLMLLSGWRLHPLWRSPLLPFMFLMSSIAMGYGAVVLESVFSSVTFRRKPEIRMLSGLAVPMMWLLYAVVAVRLLDIRARGQMSLMWAGDGKSLLFWVEMLLFLLPATMLASPERRRDLGNLMRASIAMLFAGALYRFDTYLVAFSPGPNWSYFPSVGEILITVGLVAAEVAVYVTVVRMFPILAGRPKLAESHT